MMRTKVATAASGSLIARPRLETRLDEIFGKRLALVVAGAGYGKSTLLSGWSADLACAWYTVTGRDQSLSTFAAGLEVSLEKAVEGFGATPGSVAGSGDVASAETVAATIASRLDAVLTHDLILVIDDAHLLESTPSLRLVESLCRQAPSTLHIVLASREPLPMRIERLQGQGAVLELTGAELAFTPDEVTTVSRDALGDDLLAVDLHAATGGWPAAVRLTIEALSHAGEDRRAPLLAALRESGSPIFEYLAHEVFGREEPETRELIRRVAVVDRFTSGLCEALGLESAPDVLRRLTQRGLFVFEQSGWLTLHALVRDFAQATWPLTREERTEVLHNAALWCESHELYEDSLRCYQGAGELDEVRRLLVHHGAMLLERGAAETVIEIVRSLPTRLTGPELDVLLGDALMETDSVDEALACFERVAGDGERLDAGIAWRLMRVLHRKGDFQGARRTARRAAVDSGDLLDRIEALAWAASVTGLAGELDEARAYVQEALALASDCADDRALADLHTAAAIVAGKGGRLPEGDMHGRAALAAAERAHDVPRAARARTNIGSDLVDRGEHRAAIEEFDKVIEASGSAGADGFMHALGNRGIARWTLGLLDEAHADYAELAALGRDHPYHRCVSLVGTADIHRDRGNTELARTSYAAGLTAAEEVGQEQLHVVSLCGLARCLVDVEPTEADRLVERAFDRTSADKAWVACARGWLALALGDVEVATHLAAVAADEARTRRLVYELAEALALQGMASAAPYARGALEESHAIWSQVGNRVHVALLDIALARAHPDLDSQRVALRATRRLRAYGVRLRAAAPAGLGRALALPSPTAVSVQTLGGFALLRGGSSVAEADWQSRKARELLKILVARRGRATPRPLLMEALWPNEDPQLLTNRLSVALSTLRSVLDPERRFEPDAFVRTSREAVALGPDVLVDVDAFLREAEEARSLRAGGRSDDATERLEFAESMYAGDFLDEDPYVDWAVSLREEARAAYVAVAYTLGLDALETGEADAAVRHFLRMLAADGYDEAAHLGLVSAFELCGRHGESRRAYRTYVGRMEEIDVTPAAFPRAPVTSGD